MSFTLIVSFNFYYICFVIAYMIPSLVSTIYWLYTDMRFLEYKTNAIKAINIIKTLHTCAARERMEERVLVLIDHCVPGPQNEETIA